MNKDQEKKDILNYESDYGKDLHEKNLMKDVRKKEIKKYEKDHERNNSKERMNINMYVDNLNIDKFDNSTDNSNYGNNIAPSGQSNLDLNMDWSIKSSEPLYDNNGLQLPKSNNNIKEEEIINSKIYKDMENNYKEALNRFNESTYKLSEADAKIKRLKKFISKFIDFVLLFIKDKDDQKKITAVMKMCMEDDDDE